MVFNLIMFYQHQNTIQNSTETLQNAF